LFKRTVSGCSPTRTTTPKSAPVCGGRRDICPSTAVGTGACCSGPGVTPASRPPASTRTTLTRIARQRAGLPNGIHSGTTRSPGSHAGRHARAAHLIIEDRYPATKADTVGDGPGL
jgi:hypothetical protein